MDPSNEKSAIAHIESKPEVCGGKPCIAGTRIRVWDIHVWHDLQGRSPAEIATEFPQVTVSGVYAALTYFHDHREEIQAQMDADEAFSEKLKAAQAPSKLSTIRSQLHSGKGGNGSDGGDPVSS